MRRGRVVGQRPDDKVFASPQDPYTIELIAAAPEVAAGPGIVDA